MTVRFNTWVEADSIQEAWDKLWEKLRGGNMGDKLERVLTATVLEDPEEDKRELAPLTVKELRDYFKCFDVGCEGCVMYTSDGSYCRFCDDCFSLVSDEEIDEIAKVVRGEKK